MRLLALTIAALLSGTTVGHAADDGDPYAAPDWTGVRVGLFAAYGYGTSDSSDGADSHPQDPFGGLSLGYFHQHGDFVVGVEGEVSLADLDGDTGSGADFVSQDIDNIGAVSALAGYGIGDGLLYAKGGWGWAKSEHNTRTDSDKAWLDGPSIGIGYRYSFTESFAGRVEFTHYNYGSVTYDIPGRPRVDNDVNVAKIGIEYRFH